MSSGKHHFEVKAIDADGNEDQTPDNEPFEVEEQFPETSITKKPESPVKKTTATFHFSGSDLQTPTEKLRYSWRLDGKPWSAPSTETKAFPKDLSSDQHHFEVKAIDTDDNEDQTPADSSFEVEEQFPDTSIAKKPKSPVKTTNVTFHFSGSDLQTPTEKLRYSWRIDGKPWSAPSTETIVPLTNLSSGKHHFEVKAIDADDNEDQTPDKASFEVEEQFPNTFITQKPESMVKTTTATFHFSGKDLQTPTNKLRYSWRIDGKPWPEPSTKAKAELTDLSTGQHHFEVKAIDTDGNEDPTPADRTFEVSIEKKFPETRIIQPSENAVLETSEVTFQFKGSYNQTSTEIQYSWRTDKEKRWSTPPSTQTEVTLNFPDGPHWFQVKAIADGNDEPTPAEVSFTVNTQRKFPETEITDYPKSFVKETQDVTFKFTGRDSQTEKEPLRYSWRIDSNPWSEPTTETVMRYNQKLPKGLHWFEVKAIDADGYEDQTPDIKPFVVGDIEGKFPDAITITFPLYTTLADFEIPFEGIIPKTSVDKLLYSWRVDDEPWSEPSSDMKAPLRNLSDGEHTFKVKAVDADGKDASSPASIRIVVDTKRQYPETEITNAPQKTIEGADVIISFRGNDFQTSPEELRYSWRVIGESWSKDWPEQPSREQMAPLKNLPKGRYWFEVKAIDADNNADPTPAAIQFLVAIPWYKNPVKLSSVFIPPVIILALILGIFRYVTKKKERRIQTLKSVIDNWAHQLGTPLSVLRLSVERLITQINEERVPEPIYTKIAAHEVDSLINMTNEILDLRRLEGGVSILHPEDGTIREIVDEVVDSVQYAAEVKSIDINTCIPEQPVLVHWDTKRIISVLYNIVVNAIVHSRSPQIDISCHVENNSVCFKITDYGIGIAKKDIPKIFERFWTKGEYTGGSGLGLAYAKSIVEEHGGRIDVESELRKGSTFSVYLPIHFRRKG